jgi:hypothetical protein
VVATGKHIAQRLARKVNTAPAVAPSVNESTIANNSETRCPARVAGGRLLRAWPASLLR